MASGSKDYWTTKDNWMYSLLTIVKEAVKENGLIHTALDSMDGKLDGVVNLETLTEAQTVYLAKMFLTDTVDGNGKNLLTKLDALDGVADGKLDLSQMQTFDIFYDSVAGKSRLEQSIAQLVLTVEELVGVHSDTTDMVAYGEEDSNGTVFSSVWHLVASTNQRRNMLEVSHVGGGLAYFSRDNSSIYGSIPQDGSTIFYDPPGVWLKAWSSGSSFTAHEEWAT